MNFEKSTGLIALSFDAFGRQILDALCSRPEMPNSTKRCYHIEQVSEPNDRFLWHERQPSGAWEPAAWSQPDIDFLEGLQEAMSDALSVSGWEHGKGAGLFDIIVISPIDPAEANSHHRGCSEAILSIKQRFKRSGRTVLLVSRQFEIISHTSPGVLKSLPGLDRDDDVFDLFILMDKVNTQGLVIEKLEKKAEQIAGIITRLTLSDTASVIHRSVQAERARMGNCGRFVSFGLAEWQFNHHYAHSLLCNYLYRRMAQEIVTSPDGEEPLACGLETDIAKQILELLLPQESQNDVQSVLQQMLCMCADELHKDFRRSGFSLGFLLKSLEHRLESLRRELADARNRLGVFMQRFAIWYVAPEDTKQAPPQVHIEQVEKPYRKLIFGTCIVGAALSGSTVFAEACEGTLRFIAGILAALFFIAAVILGVLGFSEEVMTSIPSPPVKREDLRPELTRLRKLNWVLEQLVKHFEGCLAATSSDWKTLTQDAATGWSPVEGGLPIPDDVCCSLVCSGPEAIRDYLSKFWTRSSMVAGTIVRRTGESMVHRLREYAQQIAEGFPDFSWGERLAAAISRTEQDDNRVLIRQMLEQSLASSFPWMPVPGYVSKTVVVCSKQLGPELAEAVGQCIPGRTLLEETDGDGVCVLQWTQGYRTLEEITETEESYDFDNLT